MEKFDLIVIGAGPSGYAAAMRALDFKKKVLLIEKSRVGGAGVTNGALSSKTWWELSREASACILSAVTKKYENLTRGRDDHGQHYFKSKILSPRTV